MTDPLAIEVRWLERSNGSPAEQAGFGELEIRCGDSVLTEVLDTFAGTVRSSVRVSVLHFGTWLVSNWWRLRFEPRPRPAALESDWRMTHELAGAGGGFAWPWIRIASDGETVHLSARETNDKRLPVRFFQRADRLVSATEWERVVDDFVARLLERLDSRRAESPELWEAWNVFQAERRDPVLAQTRRREALLGLDPDQISRAELAEILNTGRWMGEAALDETMAAARNTDIRDTIADLRSARTHSAGDLDLRALDSVRRAWRQGARSFALPWQRGAALARFARQELGINSTEPIPSRRLSELIGRDLKTLQTSPGALLASGFRIQDGGGSRWRFRGRRRHPLGRRFEAARLLADFLDGPQEDMVLPITDAFTARQKVQRSFAQEFLCPVAALSERLSSLPSDDEIEEAAEFFGVSDRTVRTALVNHGLVDRSYLPEGSVS